MKQHKLGPNGAIMTCLNLYATKFDQVMSILEQRAFEDSPVDATKEKSTDDASTTPISPAPKTFSKNLDYILVDTPGQIEAFTWSASGTVITTALASAFPTVLAFVVDTPRCTASLNTFMSNMLYACSMYYRTRLPLIVVFNKTDVMSGDVCMEWMNDYGAFQDALDDFIAGDGAGYYASLTRSLSLVLEEFYSILHKVGVSAATGEGVDQFWSVVEKAAEEFDDEYVGDLECRVEEQKLRKKAIALDSMKRMEHDLKIDGVE
jgi:GTPase Era involved in 16S rRNA processing